MIKRKNYNALIEKVKVFAKQDPAGYKKRVVLLGVLGYAYIFLILAVLIGLIVGIVLLMMNMKRGSGGLIQIMLFLGILAWAIMRSLWIKIEAPVGYSVTEANAPKLFAIIKEICALQKSALPDQVFINNDFNAFISQVPRLGIFGWYKNYLVLGLPYMMASDLNQFKAVIAHEFGHFSGAHGRSGIWLYRIRASWYNIMAHFEEDKVGKFIFGWFFDWYVPYFNAYSFVLAREHEYEADRYANNYAGAEANAEELVNAVIKGGNTTYWQSVWDRVIDEPLPPNNAFSAGVARLKDPIPEQEYRDRLDKALKVRTQNLDTHPALRDRLAAMGYAVRGEHIVDEQGKPLVYQKAIERSAAQELLDEDMATQALKKFDEEWYIGVEASWKERHIAAQKMKQELSVLEQKLQNGSLNDKDMADRAFLIDELKSPQEATAAIRELIHKQPNYAPAHYRLGILLLEQNNEEGVLCLKRTMELDAAYASDCLERISWFHESKGEYEQVENVLDDLDDAAAKDRKDYEERNRVIGSDKFKPHDLPEDVVIDLREQLKVFSKELNYVYLVQKEVKVYPQTPMYVIAVNGKARGFHWDTSDFNQKLADKLVTTIKPKIIAGTWLIYVGDPGSIGKAKKVPGSLVFSRK